MNGGFIRKITDKWSISIAMFDYRRVPQDHTAKEFQVLLVLHAESIGRAE